jgi:DMSO/TMAO reductase YedYZ heme-binding membrane subunit
LNGQLWWYVARAGGIVGWALLGASVLAGLSISTKALRGRVRPNWLLDLHRFLGGLALVFVVVHVTGVVADSYVHFGLLDVLVPFASSWRPAAVAWGVVGVYLLIAVELTSLLRRRLPARVWRATHFLSFPAFVLTTVHALVAGSDAGNPLLRWTLVAVATAVTALTLRRVQQVERGGQRITRPTPTAPSGTLPPPIAGEALLDREPVSAGRP